MDDYITVGGSIIASQREIARKAESDAEAATLALLQSILEKRDRDRLRGKVEFVSLDNSQRESVRYLHFPQ